MVIAPADTGNDNRNNAAVISEAQRNKVIRSALMFIGFMLIIVEMKLSAPRIDDTPAR